MRLFFLAAWPALLTQTTAQMSMVEEGSWPGFPRGSAIGIAAAGKYAYAVYGDAGLKVIDVQIRVIPNQLGCWTPSGPPAQSQFRNSMLSWLGVREASR